mmetsp:Transcript_14499/g.39765  ORF Transcript_14499/g.39765 Transcript_14499/m.39765 type:complete len:232 (+) Transcript_14499:254-949(+)
MEDDHVRPVLLALGLKPILHAQSSQGRALPHYSYGASSHQLLREPSAPALPVLVEVVVQLALCHAVPSVERRHLIADGLPPHFLLCSSSPAVSPNHQQSLDECRHELMHEIRGLPSLVGGSGCGAAHAREEGAAPPPSSEAVGRHILPRGLCEELGVLRSDLGHAVEAFPNNAELREGLGNPQPLRERLSGRLAVGIKLGPKPVQVFMPFKEGVKQKVLCLVKPRICRKRF